MLSQDKVDDFLETIKHAEFIEIDRAAPHDISGDRNDIFANSYFISTKDLKFRVI